MRHTTEKSRVPIKEGRACRGHFAQGNDDLPGKHQRTRRSRWARRLRKAMGAGPFPGADLRYLRTESSRAGRCIRSVRCCRDKYYVPCDITDRTRMEPCCTWAAGLSRALGKSQDRPAEPTPICMRALRCGGRRRSVRNGAGPARVSAAGTWRHADGHRALWGDGSAPFAPRSAVRYASLPSNASRYNNASLHSNASLVPGTITSLRSGVTPFLAAGAQVGSPTVTPTDSSGNSVGSTVTVVVQGTYSVVLPCTSLEQLTTSTGAEPHYFARTDLPRAFSLLRP